MSVRASLSLSLYCYHFDQLLLTYMCHQLLVILVWKAKPHGKSRFMPFPIEFFTFFGTDFGNNYENMFIRNKSIFQAVALPCTSNTKAHTLTQPQEMQCAYIYLSTQLAIRGRAEVFPVQPRRMTLSNERDMLLQIFTPQFHTHGTAFLKTNETNISKNKILIISH